MYPWLRLTWVLWRPRRTPRPDLFAGSRISFRAWPADLDLNGHVTNSRYLALMDLARYDLVRQAGLWDVVQRNGWWPVVAQQAIRFRRSLPVFRRFTVHTRQVGWDERSVYLEQRFEQDGEEVAVGVVRATFLSKAGRVAPAKLMTEAGFAGPSPEIPEWVKAWVGTSA